MSLLPIAALAAAGLIGAVYLTNPFTRFSVIKKPFIVRSIAGVLHTINNNHKLIIRQSPFWRYFAIIKCGMHILATRYIASPRSRAQTIEGIISDIRRLRFDPNKLLLISGDHFSALFVRNLGVFYYPTLDGRLKDTRTAWQNRQIVYLQTVAYALGVFAKYPVPTTTIVSTGPYTATCVNFYAYPSDTVYGIFYALAALLDKEPAAPYKYKKPEHSLHTQLATELLLGKYKTTCLRLYGHYRTTVFDENTGLVRRDIHLSGAKDMTRRTSAFYDNVIFWKTTQLAMKLGIISEDTAFLAQLKSAILKTFWLEKDGYFLEDLSDEGKKHTLYSSDWLIVLATGFLDPSVKAERHYFEQSIAYIQAHDIDQPFPIKYQQNTRAHRQFLAVRLAVASYGGDAIWSFWGMEYIKTLLLLYKHTGRKSYLTRADESIQAYEQNMRRDHGFPEVYDPRGKLLQTPLYRSIRQTGWVVGFEQVREMRKAITTVEKGGK